MINKREEWIEYEGRGSSVKENRQRNAFSSPFGSLLAIEKETVPQQGSYLHWFSKENYDISYKNVENKDVLFNRYLPHIIKSIDSSKYMLELEDDWDDDDANTTNLETYNSAINFIRSYALKIFNWGIKISAPKIDILRDGSIGVNWETSIASFLIVFDISNEKISYCYGKNKVNGIPFKTGIENNNIIDESVATWMKKHLKM